VTYNKGDHVRVTFDAVVVEGDEACNYLTVEPGPYFGLYGQAQVHFQHALHMKMKDEEMEP
jgi:hypothetical protein